MQNDGNKDIEQLNLKLTINSIQSATAAVNTPKKGFREAHFDLSQGLKGLNEGRISFNDFPVSFDNEFTLALNFTEKINIVEIKSSTQPTVIESVFGNKEVFTYQGFSISNFDYSVLESADLVVVNGVNRIDQSLASTLRSFLDRNGVLLLIPSKDPDLESYQRFTGRSLQLKKDAKPEDLEKPDFNDPFFENVFEERSVSLAMPKASKYLSWGADRSAILRFKDDQPFLSRFDQGGKLFVIASPIQSDFTDFVNHALFVPVMYRLAASGKKDEKRLYYTLQESFIILDTDSLSGEEPLRLVGQQEIVPAQRKVGNRIMFDIPKFSISQGFYRVMNNQDTLDLVSFNLDKEESLLDQFSGAEVKKMLGDGGNISIFDAGPPEAFSNEIKARYLGKPLWKYALMLALVFLLAEVLLIRFLK
jgi:hypothetical protein